MKFWLLTASLVVTLLSIPTAANAEKIYYPATCHTNRGNLPSGQSAPDYCTCAGITACVGCSSHTCSRDAIVKTPDAKSDGGEAEAAESRNDFIHKMLICLKELRESRRWLRLVICVPMIDPVSRVEPLVSECEELIRIFFVSVRTARENGTSIVREEPAWEQDMDAFLARWWIEEDGAGNICLRESEGWL